MADLNRCTFSGRVTRDPELRVTPTDRKVLAIGLAVNDAAQDPQSGEWGERPNYLDVIVFGSRAEGLAKVLSKGRLVVVDAKAHWSSWERDGQKRSKVEFWADDVQLIGPKPKVADDSQQ